jgi:predicted subunit of tRNA(5-methylaminomethyl-2-thiouridylate) methyltransferase
LCGKGREKSVVFLWETLLEAIHHQTVMACDMPIDGVRHILHTRFAQLLAKHFHSAANCRRRTDTVPNMIQEFIVSNKLVAGVQEPPKEPQCNGVAEKAAFLAENNS